MSLWGNCGSVRGSRVRVALCTGMLAFAFTAAAGAGVATAQTTFSARGSVEQVYVTGLAAGRGDVAARPAAAATVATRNARTQLGGLLFRNVTPGSGYRVRLDGTGETSGPLTVLTTQSAPPSTDIYNQSIPSDGYGYLTTRDGTKLAYRRASADGRAERCGPASDAAADPADAPPTPTLIEYSGYGYADPAGPQSGIAVLANLMGFTVVDVNMRGTGCSGGAFDFFEPLQSLDGYDVIETIARQPWVAHNKVGMMGISYGGISQLFTAQTQPAEPGRDLAALGARPDADDALSGRHPEHRLRGRLGEGARSTRPSRRRTRRRPALGLPADPGGRHDLRRQPGPAPARRRTCWRRSAPTTTTTRRSPTRSSRSRSSTRSTSRSSWPASGPTSRPAGTARRWPSTSPAPTRSGSRSPTARTSTRSIPRPSTAGTTS